MAGKKENLKSLFTNTRTRVIIVFTAILLISAVVIGYFKFKSSSDLSGASSNVTITPGIQSIPGALNPTVQYAKLQQIQNVDQAQTALKKGGSAIPTIIRTQALGQGVQPIGEAASGEGGLGFTALAREDDSGTQRAGWIQTLQNSSCSKASVVQVVTEGAALTDLKAACNCTQLKDNGYQIAKLEQICSCKELRAAGFNARQLKDAGFSAGRLRLCGFDACELRNAGFTAQQMKDGGFTDGELKGAGFSEAEIAKASGLPAGVTESAIRSAGCQVEALRKLRAQGVSAAAIRRISGCSAAQLKAAGFTAEELRNAGFSAADLKNAGFSAADLKAAGYTARDLLNAGFSPDDLANAGFSPADIAAAESELPPGISPVDVKNNGCDVGALKKERLAGVSAKLIRQYAGCSAKALKEAGFTANDLANAGFTPEQINGVPLDDAAVRAAGCDPTKLRVLYNQGVSAARIHGLNGCNAAQLQAAGFSSDEANAAMGTLDNAIRAAGCDPSKLKELFKQGISAARIHELNGCSAQALKNAGYGAKALSDAGFSPQQLLDAGFSPQDLAKAGVNAAAVIAAGRTADCSIASLKAARAAGVSATTIKQTLGCSAAAMKAAGYTAKELRDAGFTAAELKNAGFSAAELKAAGFSAKELKDAGFSASDLKAAGFSANELKDAGFSAAELKNAGFSAAELKAAGYSAKELKDAGFSAADLRAAGFSAKDLKDAGFSAADLKAAGFSAKDLRDAGFSAKDLRDAGFSASALRQAGYSAKDLADAGYSANDLKNAGYSAAEISAATSQVAGLGQLNLPDFGASNVTPIPGVPGVGGQSANAIAAAQAANAQQLQTILKKQNQQLMDQRYQQKIQQRTAQMLSSANQSLQGWQKISTQSYVGGNDSEAKGAGASLAANRGGSAGSEFSTSTTGLGGGNRATPAMIKTGDILFGVIDTSVNSDEPGPILATIVSGKLKGTKLIGSFNLPSNADKMVITFNTMSIPGAPKTISINAYAIDANTARTALSSNTNHHYMLRYGSLFASSFLEGIGNAFQSADTTVTVGGTGGGQNITVQNGIDRSVLQNAVIALGTVGKQWGQVAQQQFNTPTTVEVYSGTGVGILFTQDVATPST